MSDLQLVEQLRTTAAFKAFDPSGHALAQLLRTAADRLEFLTGERPVIGRGTWGDRVEPSSRPQP